MQLVTPFRLRFGGVLKALWTLFGFSPSGLMKVPSVVQDVCLRLSWASILGHPGTPRAISDFAFVLPSLCLRFAFALPSLCLRFGLDSPLLYLGFAFAVPLPFE